MLTEALNSHLPEKHRKRKNNKNWIDNEVTNLATKKRSLKKLADATGSPQINENFQKTCKNLKSLIKSKKQTYQNLLKTDSVKNRKTFFQLYSSLTGNSVSCEIFCSQNKVEEFNEFFSNIGKKLNAEFLTRSTPTIENKSQSMFLKSISENDVKYAINNCKNKFSLDCYNFELFFIKKVSDCLTAPLHLMFNRCIELGQYSESL